MHVREAVRLLGEVAVTRAVTVEGSASSGKKRCGSSWGVEGGKVEGSRVVGWVGVIATSIQDALSSSD